MANSLDKYLKSVSTEKKALIEKKGKILDNNTLEQTDVKDIHKEKNQTHKERTGKDLDQNVGGYDNLNKPSEPKNPISKDVAAKAKQAAEPVKPQGNSAYLNNLRQKTIERVNEVKDTAKEVAKETQNHQQQKDDFER